MNDRQKKKHRIYMNMAHEAASLATCDRKHVGAIIVKNDRVISQGFNGAPSGFDHCSEVGHLMHEGHCVRVVHAEINALLHADREELKDASIYITCSPCLRCFITIANTGISNIYYEGGYKEHRKEKSDRDTLAEKNNIDITNIEEVLT